MKLVLLIVWAIAAALPFFLSGEPWAWLIGLGVVLWLIVITNAVNFMDGANGLALGTSAVMIVGLFPLYAILMLCLGNCVPDPLGEFAIVAQFAFFGAVLGFLAWNLRGVLYAGDCGSLGTGGLFGLMAVYHLDVSMDGVRTALLGVTLALPFLIDVLLTLALAQSEGAQCASGAYRSCLSATDRTGVGSHQRSGILVGHVADLRCDGRCDALRCSRGVAGWFSGVAICCAGCARCHRLGILVAGTVPTGSVGAADAEICKVFQR